VYLIFWIAFSPNPNAFSKTILLMPELNNATACICCTWVLAVQCCNCSTIAHIELKVQKTSGEHKHIALLQCGCKKCSIGADETNEQRTLHHENDLCGPRVCVGWDETSCSEVEACHGNAQSVDARELSCSCCSDATSKGVVGVSRGGQAGEHEVICLHKGRVLADQTVNDGGVVAIGDTEVCSGLASDAMAIIGRRASCNTKSATVTRRT